LRLFKISVIILVNERTKNCMDYAKLSVSFIYILAWFHSFWRRSHVMLELCLYVVIFKTSILKSESHFTLTSFPEFFIVTPLAIQTRHLSCVSDGVGQCLLPLTSSLSTHLSVLCGLPNGLCTLRSSPTCASIFLTRVNKKSLCEISLSPQEKWRMQLLRMIKSTRWKNNLFVHLNWKFGTCVI